MSGCGRVRISAQHRVIFREVKNGFIDKVLDREVLYYMQTPQIAKTNLLINAHDYAIQQRGGHVKEWYDRMSDKVVGDEP